jgi:hypothetical protein
MALNPGQFAPSYGEVKELRERTGMGVEEATRQLVLLKMKDRLEYRCNNETLRDMLRVLMSMMMLRQ